MKYTLLMLILFVLGCSSKISQENLPPNKEEIHTILNGWHKAAANADFDKYFGYFESDSAIFMGTDATERWTVAAFKPWSKPFFDRGKAWSFTADSRVVYFSENGKTAWFDETLVTPNLGPCRGTGVLTKKSEGWKIAHYNLTVPIPNELVGDVVKQIDSVLSK